MVKLLFVLGSDGAVPAVIVAEVTAWIVKLAFEISKKILFAHTTLMRALVVGVFGTIIVCVPSLGVSASMVCGNVAPPSVESRIVTFGQLTGAWVVLATFHVTVCWLPPAHVTAVFGAVILNGPEPPAIVIFVKSF